MSDTLALLQRWSELEHISFDRSSILEPTRIACDCSGLINLLFQKRALPSPYGLKRPKAVHYFNILQEIGSASIQSLKAGSLLAWRKDQLPKSGDTGHVLVTASAPEKIDSQRYRVWVYDATKACKGLSKRQIELHTTDMGQIIGVRLHLDSQVDGASKVKRCAIYHAALEGGRYCFGCGLPSKVCQCGRVEPSMEIPNVIVLRHPDERGRTLSTVSLIKQRYPNVLVREGETFSPMRAPNLALLFPSDERESSEVSEGRSLQQNTQTLILLDATWRKAKKILHLNPWLEALPKVSLNVERMSNYLLRKIPNEGALSSVEAFASVMQDRSLDHLFVGFMDAQIKLMGEEVYLRNYKAHLNYPKAKS